ncbi:hypothetical protein QJQ45_003904 [Haematococcus lacustris]|nr:hypothetical protein QJQ45_003904 [Haematococcus lacustris]
MLALARGVGGGPLLWLQACRKVVEAQQWQAKAAWQGGDSGWWKLRTSRGSQEESKVPWDDSQDELFAELYAKAFAEPQKLWQKELRERDAVTAAPRPLASPNRLQHKGSGGARKRPPLAAASMGVQRAAPASKAQQQKQQQADGPHGLGLVGRMGCSLEGCSQGLPEELLDVVLRQLCASSRLQVFSASKLLATALLRVVSRIQLI